MFYSNFLHILQSNIEKMELKSTYGVQKDWSYRGENFYYVPLTWRLHSINILKIRIANWKPKYNRCNEALFYFDATTTEEATTILESFKDFNFKKIEKYFENLYIKDEVYIKNTGEVNLWLEKNIPILKNKFGIVK